MDLRAPKEAKLTTTCQVMTVREKGSQLFVPCVCFAEISSPKMTLDGPGGISSLVGCLLSMGKALSFSPSIV